MISSVKTHSFGPSAATSRAKPGAFKLQELDEHLVKEVAAINPSDNQDAPGLFSFNDLAQQASNLAIEAEIAASDAGHAGDEPEVPDIPPVIPVTPDSLDTGDPPDDGGGIISDGYDGEFDRRARPGGGHESPTEVLSAEDSLVVANNFAPEPGLDVVTGGLDMRQAVGAYESVMAVVKAHGMRPGDILDSNL